MPAPVTPQQLAFFAILLVALALLVTERLPTDAVAMLIILSLVFTGVLPTDDALAGFKSEPALVIAAIFVISAGFQTTGLADWLGRSDLDVDRALNLDGGSSTGLYLNAGALHEAIDAFGPLPIVLLVEAK